MATLTMFVSIAMYILDAFQVRTVFVSFIVASLTLSLVLRGIRGMSNG